MSLTESLIETVQTLPDDKQQEVLDFAHFLRERNGANALPPPQPKIPLPPQSGLSTLLEQWRQEDSTTDEEDLRAAQAELDEFKRDLNANRVATGERLLFPDRTATAALFAEMSDDEEDDTPEQIAQGVRDWEAFRHAINETRSNAGARIIYP